MTYIYTLSGVVHPERADVNISDAGAVFSGGDLEGELKLSIFRSRIAATFTSSNELAHPAGLRFMVESVVRAVVDTLGFVNGCGYDVEVVQLVDNQSNDHYVFGVDEPVITSLKIFERLPTLRVAELHPSRFGVYLQRAFGDLREALRNPRDSAFFCYRAIESLSHYFAFEEGAEGRRASWEALRETLAVDGEQLYVVKEAADPQRHGNPRAQPATSREEVLRVTWLVVEKFVVYALSLMDAKKELQPTG